MPAVVIVIVVALLVWGVVVVVRGITAAVSALLQRTGDVVSSFVTQLPQIGAALLGIGLLIVIARLVEASARRIATRPTRSSGVRAATVRSSDRPPGSGRASVSPSDTDGSEAAHEAPPAVPGEAGVEAHHPASPGVGPSPSSPSSPSSLSQTPAPPSSAQIPAPRAGHRPAGSPTAPPASAPVVARLWVVSAPHARRSHRRRDPTNLAAGAPTFVVGDRARVRHTTRYRVRKIEIDEEALARALRARGVGDALAALVRAPDSTSANRALRRALTRVVEPPRIGPTTPEVRQRAVELPLATADMRVDVLISRSRTTTFTREVQVIPSVTLDLGSYLATSAPMCRSLAEALNPGPGREAARRRLDRQLEGTIQTPEIAGLVDATRPDSTRVSAAGLDTARPDVRARATYDSPSATVARASLERTAPRCTPGPPSPPAPRAAPRRSAGRVTPPAPPPSPASPDIPGRRTAPAPPAARTPPTTPHVGPSFPQIGGFGL